MVKINNDVDKILVYCGFNRRSNRKKISENVFDLFKEFVSLTDKDMGNLSEGFSERNAANRRIIFWL